MGQMISFARTGGGNAQGYLAESKNAKGPGVVVIQEWWGLQGQIKAVCDRLAQDGVTALAPDLYNGKVVAYHHEDEAGAAEEGPHLQGGAEAGGGRGGAPLSGRGGRSGGPRPS